MRFWLKKYSNKAITIFSLMSLLFSFATVVEAQIVNNENPVIIFVDQDAIVWGIENIYIADNVINSVVENIYSNNISVRRNSFQKEQPLKIYKQAPSKVKHHKHYINKIFPSVISDICNEFATIVPVDETNNSIKSIYNNLILGIKSGNNDKLLTTIEINNLTQINLMGFINSFGQNSPPAFF